MQRWSERDALFFLGGGRGEMHSWREREICNVEERDALLGGREVYAT